MWGIIILTIMQDKHEFELSTLPALVPVLSSASGETLLLIVKHAELIITKVTVIFWPNLSLVTYS